MKTRQVKIGFAPTRRAVFSPEAAVQQKSLIEAKLREWGISRLRG